MRGAYFLGLILVVLGVAGCGKKKPPAPPPAAVPPTPSNPNREAGERVQREVALGYLIAGVPAVNELPGEDLDGDGAVDVGRMAFDTQLRLQQLILARRLGIGFGREQLKSEQARRFTGADGRANAAQHQAFLEKTLPANGLAVADWDRFVANEMALAHLHQLMSLTGVLLPGRVARELFARDHELFEAEIIPFASTNHVKSVAVPPNALPAFYTNNLNRYRPAEQLDMVRVRIPFSLFEEVARQPVAGLEESVRTIYKQRGASAFKDKAGQQLPVAEAHQRLRRMLLARRRFAVLAEEILKSTKVDVARLRKVLAGDAAKPKLSLEEVTIPARGEVPRPLRLAVRAVEKLPPGALAADPVFEDGALSLVGLVRRVQPPLPPFGGLSPAQRDAIREDYVAEKSWEAARNRGRGFHQLLANRMARGESLAKVAASAALKPVALPDFTLSQTAWPKSRISPAISLGVAQESVHTLLSQPAPAVGAFVPQPWGGFILHLKKRAPVANSAAAKEFTGYRKLLRTEGLSAARQLSVQPHGRTELAPGPPGWYLRDWERLRLAMFVELKNNSSAHAKAVTAARARLQDWPGLLGEETSANAPEFSAKAVAANDAVLQLSLSTNVVKSSDWMQLAVTHADTPAARRARLLGAVAFYAEDKPKEAAGHFAKLTEVAPADPLTPVARLGYAVALDEQGDPGAAAAYRAAIAANPRHLAAVIARLGLAALEKNPVLCQEVVESDPVGYWARLAGGLRQQINGKEKNQN